MKRGCVIGYDINEKGCQISYYDDSMEEPDTMMASSNNYLIPLVLGYFKDRWVFGKEAKRLAVVGEDCTETDLYGKAKRREKVSLAGKTYDAVWLLAKYISLTLQDYKESFCQYMIFQPKELWQYESALFYCDEDRIKAYMLRRLRVDASHGMNSFVTVDEVANAQRKELEALYPIMNKEKSPDESFKSMIENVFEKKVISSVYLTGEGFEKNWYPNSLRVLCNGRRAFMGNNLYSKGACYKSIRKCEPNDDGPIYLDETKLTERICLRMRVDGQEGWYPLVTWGTHWYEADGQWEVLLEDASDIEILVESLVDEEVQVEKVSLEGLPKRTDYSLRLQVEAMFLDERTCKLTFRDVGFGEFFTPTDFRVEKTIQLGGINGQFNSMS